MLTRRTWSGKTWSFQMLRSEKCLKGNSIRNLFLVEKMNNYLTDILLDQECPFHVLETWLLVNTTMEENIRKGTSRLSCSGSIVCQAIFRIKCCALLCAIYLLAGFLQAMELHKLSTKMDKKVEQMNFKVFVSTRPKLAYGRQSLD